MRWPEVELSEPKVIVRSRRSGRSVMPESGAATNTEWNSASRGRCAIASASGTANRAWTPVRPPYHAMWMSPCRNAVTTAA